MKTDIIALLQENEDYIGYVTTKEAADVLEKAGYRMIGEEAVEGKHFSSLSSHLYRFARSLTPEEYSILFKETAAHNDIVDKEREESKALKEQEKANAKLAAQQSYKENDKNLLISRLFGMRHTQEVDPQLWQYISTSNGVSASYFNYDKISDPAIRKEYNDIRISGDKTSVYLFGRKVTKLSLYCYEEFGLMTRRDPNNFSSMRRYILAPEGDPLSYKFHTLYALKKFIETATDEEIEAVATEAVENYPYPN